MKPTTARFACKSTLIVAALLFLCLPLAAQQPPPLITNARVPAEGVLFGGQLTPEQVEVLAAKGYKTILDLRGEAEDRGFDEPAAVEAAGMTYAAVPVDAERILQPKTFESFFQAFETMDRPIVVHCASGNRVGALYYAWLVSKEGQDREEALTTAKAHGLRSEELATAVDRYLDSLEN